MPIKVAMEDFRILDDSIAERYMWTQGLGDCIAVAAKNRNTGKVLFAHLTSHQYLTPLLKGQLHDRTTNQISQFVRAATDIYWVINFEHEPKTISNIRLKLGLHSRYLRVAGNAGAVDITLHIQNFEIFRGSPNHVNELCNLAGFRYQNPQDRTRQPADGGCNACVIS